MNILPKFVKNWKKIALWSYFLAWTVYFFCFWSQALFLDKDGNLMAGLVNIWGDWAAHLTMVTAIATRGPLIHSPFLLGAKLSYPFLINLISAGLLQLRVPLITAMILPSFICSLFLVYVLFWFYRVIFKSGKVAIISSLIFLLNGGVGFYYFLQDAIASGKPLQFWWNIPHEYTRLDAQHIKWISVIDSMVIPQRSFVLGFPLALLALGLLWKYVVNKTMSKNTKKTPRSKWWAVAIACGLIGILPFAHTHSFLACFVILGFWSICSLLEGKLPARMQKLKWWVGIAGVVSLLALPLIQQFYTGHVDGKFLQWYPGWLATEFKMNWLVFWWKNWLITPLLAAVGALVFLRQTKWLSLVQKCSLVLPFFFLFAAANLFLFQPFSWDNTKLIVWAAVGFAGLAGYFIIWLGQKSHWRMMLAVTLFVITIASGSIDAYRVLRVPLHSYAMFAPYELQLANWVKANTPVNSIWLTGDQHNHWLFDLTGRQTVMAYRGWLWSQGYEYLRIEHDVIEMFSGSPTGLELLKKYDISYIVIGPNERASFHADEAKFEQFFPVVFSLGETRIYQVKSGSLARLPR